MVILYYWTVTHLYKTDSECAGGGVEIISVNDIITSPEEDMYFHVECMVLENIRKNLKKI